MNTIGKRHEHELAHSIVRARRIEEAAWIGRRYAKAFAAPTIASDDTPLYTFDALPPIDNSTLLMNVCALEVTTYYLPTILWVRMTDFALNDLARLEWSTGQMDLAFLVVRRGSGFACTRLHLAAGDFLSHDRPEAMRPASSTPWQPGSMPKFYLAGTSPNADVWMHKIMGAWVGRKTRDVLPWERREG